MHVDIMHICIYIYIYSVYSENGAEWCKNLPVIKFCLPDVIIIAAKLTISIGVGMLFGYIFAIRHDYLDNNMKCTI